MTSSLKNALIILFLFSFTTLYSQRLIRGVVIDQDKNPVPASITIKGKTIGTVADINGRFSIEAEKNDILVISFVGYSSAEIQIAEGKDDYSITLTETSNLEEVTIAGFASSSEWLGATLFYNLDGSDIDNVVGAGVVKLNGKKFSALFSLNIVGNITKFTSGLDTTKLRENIRSVAQSAQGLSAGLEPLFTFIDRPEVTWRAWAGISYKINVFTKNEDDENKNLSLSQGVFSIGSELEAVRFDNGGRMHFGFSLNQFRFSSERYNDIFKKKISYLNSFEWSVIVPLGGNLGLLVTQTITKDVKPVIGAGIVIKN